MRLDIFGIRRTETNSPSLRLVQPDRLRKEFARFFNFVVVRHHIGGRTTRTPVQYNQASKVVSRPPHSKNATFLRHYPLTISRSALAFSSSRMALPGAPPGQ